jgi:hypothetical protein
LTDLSTACGALDSLKITKSVIPLASVYGGGSSRVS